MSDILFYGQPGCMPCHILRMNMMRENINFSYRDVRNPDDQLAMLEASGGRFLTPTLVIGSKVLQNPDLQSVKEAMIE